MHIRTLLSSAAVSVIATGAASALGLENLEPVGAPEHSYPVADSLDYASGITEIVEVGFGPSAGSFPSGNVLVFVDVTGGTFNSVLTGAEVAIPGGSSVISSGGLKGGTSVTFLVSGVDACTADAIPLVADTSCSVSIPIDLDGSDVSFSVGLETDSGAPIDNSASTNRVSFKVIETVPAFRALVAPDFVPTFADLAAINGPYTDLFGDNYLGFFGAGPNVIENANTMLFETVNSDFVGTDVGPANAGAVTFTLTGEQDAFDTMAGGTIIAAGPGTIVPNAATDIATGTIAFGSTLDIFVIPDGTVPIERSEYEVAISIEAAAAGPIQQAFSGSGFLEPIDRNGAAIIFPWTQSASQGAASGTTSVYRFGNLASSATGTVFAEVWNSSEAGYTNPGIVEIASSIPAGSELVTASSALEAALGNYGRGDVAFYIDADPNDLTGRQFVVRDGIIQQVKGGTIAEDLN